MRKQLADKWIRGHGIEIGGLHCPVPVPDGVKVTYVDRAPLEEVALDHPDVVARVKDYIVDDGETLSKFADGSQQFVIACHVLEHCHKTLSTLKNWSRVLAPGGICYVALPDASQCFDRPRPRTPWVHLLADFFDGADDDFEHYLDWFLNSELERHPPEKAWELACAHCKKRTNIHFHCWDHSGIVELFEKCQPYCGLQLLEVVRHGSESIGILKKI